MEDLTKLLFSKKDKTILSFYFTVSARPYLIFANRADIRVWEVKKDRQTTNPGLIVKVIFILWFMFSVFLILNFKT
jgi:hypothetical protein